jgi:transporter family-2 protein
MPYLLLLLFAVVIGASLTVQAALNSELGRAVGSSVYGALLSFAVGIAGLFVYLAFSRIEWSNWRKALELPWYYWLGGLLGALYVTGIIVLAPRLGTALTFGLTIAGQMILGLIMDHFGWLNLPVNPITGWRVIGVILIVAGVILIRTS